jgi:hypothetical protein
MVQPKYSPEEALQRIKLMMEYDSSKTLNENKKVIFEQEECSNPITDDEMEEIVDEMWDKIQSLQTAIVRVFYDKKESAKNIYNTISSLIDRNYQDTLSKKCEPAIEAFKKIYKERAKEGGWLLGLSTEGDIAVQLEKLSKDSYFKSEGSRGLKYLDAAIKLLRSPTKITDTPKPDPNKPDPNKPDPNKPVQPRYRDCGEGPFTRGCRTTPEGPIGQVQACLGGLVQDGKFWDKTQAALEAKGYSNGFTKEDIKTICGNQTEPKEVTPLPQDDELLDVDSM